MEKDKTERSLLLSLLLLELEPIQFFLLFSLFHHDPIRPRPLSLPVLLQRRSIPQSDTQRVLLQLFLPLDLGLALDLFGFVRSVRVTGVPMDIFPVLPTARRGVDRVACQGEEEAMRCRSGTTSVPADESSPR